MKHKKKLILPPKKTKFKKQHKGLLTSIEWKKSASRLTFGIYGLKLLKSWRFNVKQLENFRRHLAKFLKKQQTIWFRVRPDIPVSKKPNEIRMGKGKGAVNFFAARLKAGQILVEFNFLPLKTAQKIFLLSSTKLPVPCILIKKANKI